MAWRKLGRIFAPSGELDWSRSHAALPVPEWIEGDIFRIYFSGAMVRIVPVSVA